jgi:hypothetical protein
MKKMLLLLIFPIFVISSFGCATATRINNISLNMTKNEVIKTLGNPSSSSAQGKTEYLKYFLYDTGSEAYMGLSSPYYVRLIDGKVESYGRMGDFDSAKIPESKSTVDLNINK